MDIELPNGTIIQEVPEGTSKADVMAKAIKAGLAKQEDFPVEGTAPSSNFLMGLKDPISGGAQLLPKALETITSLGGTAPNVLSQFFGSEAQRVGEMVKAEQEAYARQRKAQGETGFDVGRLVGNIANPVTFIGGAAMAPVTAGAIQGALQPVTDTQDFYTEKAKQVATGAVGGKVGEVVAKAIGSALNPLVSKAEQTMRDLGITPTVGQTVGGAARKAEDFAQNLPLIGEAVRNAREKVLFDFNKGVINKALDKIDDKLPANVVGRDAVAYAADQVSNKYDDVLSKMSFNLDMKTTSGILDALNKANLPSVAQRDEAAKVLNSVVLDKFAGKALTGSEYKAVESDLRKEVSSYLNSSTNAERKIGEALQGVLDTFKKELYAQNPKMTPQLRRIDSAYGDLAVMKRAAAYTGAENGVFTPKHYNAAVRAADASRQKSKYAMGTARGQDIAESALDVMGRDTASTLEGRLALSNLGGSAAALAVSPIAALMYTDSGKKIVDALLRQRPDLARQLGSSVTGAAPAIGGLFGAPTALELNR